MMMRPANVPAGAVWHDLVPFLKSHDAPSQFFRYARQRIFKLHCPACGTAQSDPAPVIPPVCIGCGLHMMKGPGLSLWTWRSEVTKPKCDLTKEIA